MKFTAPLFSAKTIVGAIFTITVLMSQVTAQQTPQRSVERYGNWTAICTKTGIKSCSIVQGIYLGNSDKPALHLAIGKLVNNNAEITTLIVTLPLGIRLPEGLSLELGANTKRQHPFERCILSGCQAEIQLDAELLKNFKDLNEGRVIFSDSEKKPVALPFSLKGFTKTFGRVIQP